MQKTDNYNDITDEGPMDDGSDSSLFGLLRRCLFLDVASSSPLCDSHITAIRRDGSGYSLARSSLQQCTVGPGFVVN